MELDVDNYFLPHRRWLSLPYATVGSDFEGIGQEINVVYVDHAKPSSQVKGIRV
jgi:hypothetical protein